MASDVAAQGSLLLLSPGSVFKDTLRRQLEADVHEDKKKETRTKPKKSKKTKKEEEKSIIEPDVKRVIREEKNSLITFGNPSVFSIFSRIRHFLLQNQLCDTFNSRCSRDTIEAEESDDEGDSEESGKKSDSKLPVVVGLGVKGVFSIIRDIWHKQPDLCLRALMEFVNILQGQSPDGLKNEPRKTTDALFELLMEMVSELAPSEHQLASQLSSVASACLLSLVIALGDTGKMLSAVAALLTAPERPEQGNVQIPQIFYQLQSSVQAVLLGSVVDSDWCSQGITSSSLVETWLLPIPEGCDVTEGNFISVAGDGSYLYFHGPFGLLKVGSGYANTKKGHVYCSNSAFNPDSTSWMGYCSEKLYFFSLGAGAETITVINTDTLTSEDQLLLESDAVGSQCMFTDGESLFQIKAKKEGGFVVRKFTTLCSPMPVTEESPLHLSQKSVLVMGRAKYDNQGDLHTACEYC